MGKACRVKYTTRTHKKRRGFMRKKVVNDSLDVGSVSDVNIVNNNDVDMDISKRHKHKLCKYCKYFNRFRKKTDRYVSIKIINSY